MKRFLIAVALLGLASCEWMPAWAADVEVIGGAGVGHEIGRPAGESFNQVFFGTKAKSWNDGTTKLWAMMRWGMYEEAAVDGLGGKLVLSDVLWHEIVGPRYLSVLFDVGFMSKYREMTDNERGVSPTVGGGLWLQLSPVIGAIAYYEAFHSGPDAQWKQTAYFGLAASTEFSIGGK